MNNEIKKNYKLVMGILMWGGIVVMSSLYITIPLINIFSSYFKTSSANATLTSSVFSVFFAIGCLFYGAISNKYGRKKVILSGILFLGIFSGLAGITHSLLGLIIFRGLQGLVAATFSPVALAYIMDFFKNERKVLALGFINTGFLTAGILGQDISMIISNRFSWKYVFLIFSCIYFITFIILYIFLPRIPIANPKMSVLNNFKQIGQVIKIKNLRFAYVISFVMLLSFVYLYTCFNSLLVSMNLTNKEIVIINFVGIIGMICSPLSSKLVRKIGNILVLRFALLLSVISLVLFAFSKNVMVLSILSILFVLGIALTAPALISLLGIVSGKHRANAISLHTFILFLGTSIAPILATYLDTKLNVSISFIFGAIILALGIIATYFIKIERKTNN